jgi:hypothetical protein
MVSTTSRPTEVFSIVSHVTRVQRTDASSIEKFRDAFKEMFPKVIGLLSHPEEQVRSTALRLSDQMGEGKIHFR